MAKLNWDRVGRENRVCRHGTVGVNDPDSNADYGRIAVSAGGRITHRINDLDSDTACGSKPSSVRSNKLPKLLKRKKRDHAIKNRKKQSCPVCGRRKKNLRAHFRDVHPELDPEQFLKKEEKE
ncbi:MAG: hypothetical protein U9Q89_06900 [Thermodesulfobacteriota bacterium]|nr:hypothetical protein [Thermodesulfobacteriota bacterium]